MYSHKQNPLWTLRTRGGRTLNWMGKADGERQRREASRQVVWAEQLWNDKQVIVAFIKHALFHIQKVNKSWNTTWFFERNTLEQKKPRRFAGKIQERKIRDDLSSGKVAWCDLIRAEATRQTNTQWPKSFSGPWICVDLSCLCSNKVTLYNFTWRQSASAFSSGCLKQTLAFCIHPLYWRALVQLGLFIQAAFLFTTVSECFSRH